MPDHAGNAAAQLHADLRQLRRLARARLARHDDHLVVADRARDLVAASAHRQVRERNHRDRGRALGQLLRREGLEGARVLSLGAAARPVSAGVGGGPISVAVAAALAVLVVAAPVALVSRALRCLCEPFPTCAATSSAVSALPIRASRRVGAGTA